MEVITVFHTRAGTCFKSDGLGCFIEGGWAAEPGGGLLNLPKAQFPREKNPDTSETAGKPSIFFLLSLISAQEVCPERTVPSTWHFEVFSQETEVDTLNHSHLVVISNPGLDLSCPPVNPQNEDKPSQVT